MSSKEKKKEKIDQESINRLVEDEINMRRYGNLNESKHRIEQKELYDLWEKDKETLETINISLQRTNNLTSKMLDTLKSFDNRVHNLLASINQVQKQTDVWKRLHTNINRAITEIDKTLEKFEEVGKLKNILYKDIEFIPLLPKRIHYDESINEDETEDTFEEETEDERDFSSSQNTEEVTKDSNEKSYGLSGLIMTSSLDEYLKALDTANELDRYFAENKNFKSANVSLETLSKLIGVGMSKILDYFNKVLDDNIKPLSIDDSNGVVEIKNKNILITGKNGIDELITNNSKGVIPLFEDIIISNMNKIIKRLHNAKGEHKSNAHLDIYVEKRSQFLLDTIKKNFNEETILRDNKVIDKKTTKSEKSMFSNFNLMKLIVNDEKEVREREFIEASAMTYTRGTHQFILLLRILLILVRSERFLAEQLLPQKYIYPSLGKIVSPTFQYFGELVEILLNFQKKTPNRIYGISVILDIYSVLKSLLPYYESVLKQVELSPEATSITQFWAKITSCGRQIFQQLTEDVTQDPSRSIPSDGNVHQLTSSVINFLTNLFLYKDSVMDLLPHTRSTSKVSPLGDYSNALLLALKDNLFLKKKKENSVLSHIFIINNLYFIWKKIKETELKDEVGGEILELCKSNFEYYQEQYKGTLNRLLSHLKHDDFMESQKDSNVLSKKYREKIKTRFRKFNSEIMDMYSEQRRFFIPDKELRKIMRTILIKSIIPSYQAFLAKYSDVPFSKHPEKYIKIDIETLESMLNQFFGGHLKGTADDVVS